MGFEMKANAVNQIPKGTEIFLENEPASYVCVIIRGRVLARSESVKLMLPTGSFLGEQHSAAGEGHSERRLEKQRVRQKMTNTVLIEQTAKNIKLAEAIVLAALCGSIAAGRGGMYLSLALGIFMFIIAGIALVGFMAVRIWRWWMHG